jgi:hypothetical protein
MTAQKKGESRLGFAFFSGTSGTPVELVTAFLTNFRVFPAQKLQAFLRLA